MKHPVAVEEARSAATLSSNIVSFASNVSSVTQLKGYGGLFSRQTSRLAFLLTSDAYFVLVGQARG